MKHSEIWHCIIMPQTCTSHSLRPFTPLLCWKFDWVSSYVYWPCNNLCQTCAHCQHCLEATRTRILMFVTFKPQGTAVKGFKTVRSEVAPGVLFVLQHAVNIHRRFVALLWMRGQGKFLPSSNICSWDFIHLCKGDWTSGAFTQRFVPSLPHCWPVPTSGRCMHLHKSMGMHLSG